MRELAKSDVVEEDDEIVVLEGEEDASNQDTGDFCLGGFASCTLEELVGGNTPIGPPNAPRGKTPEIPIDKNFEGLGVGKTTQKKLAKGHYILFSCNQNLISSNFREEQGQSQGGQGSTFS